MLKGQELLAKLAELGKTSKTEAAKACGYTSVSEAGKPRVNFTAFYAAIAEAKGIEFAESESKLTGRALSYETTVQKNGNILVGSAYTKQLELEPGDAYKIRLGRSGRITLIPADEAEDMDEADGESTAPAAAQAPTGQYAMAGAY